MIQHPEAIPGLTFVGWHTTQQGDTLPLYEIKPPAPGKLDINTIDGWNALAEIQHKKNRAAGYEF